MFSVRVLHGAGGNTSLSFFSTKGFLYGDADQHYPSVKNEWISTEMMLDECQSILKLINLLIIRNTFRQ